MRDRRSVDDLSIEELEQILRLKKRQARMERLRRFESVGRRQGVLPMPGDELSDRNDELLSIPHESFVYGPDPDEGDKRSLRDHLLLAVEIVAGLGLVSMMIFAALTLRDINREAAGVQAEEVAALPTATPTPILSAVVLPGGHKPPTGSGGAQPNYDEVPQHLRPLVEQQFAGPAVIPTSSPGNAIRIRIKAIDVDAPVVQGDGWEQLKKGVGQHLGTPDPGEPGNIVFSAHNDIFGEVFRHLDQLQVGDEIILQTLAREYVYRVIYWRIVPPDEVSVMEQTNESIVTLISCYPYLVNSDRIVVVAELVE